MKISVIVPVYNGERYLKECIQSVLEQPYRNLEVIAINDGSIDCSRNMLDSISKEDSRLKVINQKNHGVAYSRNKGIRIASGEYVAFLDQDDVWVSEFLTKEMMQKIISAKQDMISFAYYQSNENITRLMLHPRDNKIVHNAKDNAGENYRHHSSYFYRTEFLLSHGIETDGHRNEDERFRMKCLNFVNGILYIDKANFIYRNNSFSVTHQGKKEEILVDSLNGYEMLRKESKECQWLYNYCKDSELHLLLELFQSINYSKYRKYEKIYQYNNLWENHGWLSENDIMEWNLYRNNIKLFFAKNYVKNNLKGITVYFGDAVFWKFRSS